VVLVGSAACLGTIGGGGGDNSRTLGNCNASKASRSPLRRLTRLEYNHTVRDLLGDDTAPADAFVAEEQALGFDNNADALNPTQLLVEQYELAAEALSTSAVSDLNGLTGCDASAEGEDVCAERFVATVGRRAYRRSLDADEEARLVGFYAAQKAQYDHATAIRLTLKAMLLSPHFLYRVELGMPTPGVEGATRLTAYELASRLSYLLWSTMPDDELLSAAERGELESAAQVAAQARRMLEDPRARDAIANFHRQWLELGRLDHVTKDAALFPSYGPELVALLRQETNRFIEHVLLEGDGTLHTLLRADYSFMNATLAAHYGVSGAAGEELEMVPLDATRHSGLLTHASLLSTLAGPTETSPVRRGKFVRERFLCQTLPPPPPDVMITLPEKDPTATTRERFAQHTEDPMCASCHQLMDPIGFGFEHYDAVGVWRDQENDLPIDASGEMVGFDASFDGVTELAELLASSEEVRSCLVTQWFRYAYGRAEVDDDTCTLEDLRTSFAASSANIRDLLVALTQTDAFLYRATDEGGAP
ncbi:MAG TPA: DUF1592 domain-containing protein, partial [Polyangiaceae bacterium]|nr:DUF1592 domain-containing protein [Polyangiaceae bacterium]